MKPTITITFDEGITMKPTCTITFDEEQLAATVIGLNNLVGRLKIKADLTTTVSTHQTAYARMIKAKAVSNMVKAEFDKLFSPKAKAAAKRLAKKEAEQLAAFRALQHLKNLAHGDLIGRPGKCISSLRATDAPDKAGGAQRGQHTFQVLVRKLLAGGNLF